MLTQNDIETQLTQRRLDNEQLQLQLKQLQNQINELKRDATKPAETKVTQVGNIIRGITNAIGPSILVFLKTKFTKVVNFLDKVGIGTVQDPLISQLQVNDVNDGHTYNTAAVTINPGANGTVGLSLRPNTDGGQTAHLMEVNYNNTLRSYFDKFGDAYLSLVRIFTSSFATDDGQAAFGPGSDIGNWNGGVFVTNSSNKVEIKAGGYITVSVQDNKVGINIATPSEHLDVNGNAKVRQDLLVLGNIHGSGNLQIDIDAQVSGDLNVQGNYKTNGTPGVTNSINLSTFVGVIQYKDWSGANQTAAFLTGVTIDTNQFTNGIKTA